MAVRSQEWELVGGAVVCWEATGMVVELPVAPEVALQVAADLARVSWEGIAAVSSEVEGLVAARRQQRRPLSERQRGPP